MKRLLSALLVATMICTLLLSACEGPGAPPDSSTSADTATTTDTSQPAKTEPGIVRFFAYDYDGEKNYDQGLPVVEAIEKALNIKFEWEIMPYNAYEEALSIKLASGSNMPDLFYSWTQNPDVLAMNKALVPLSDYFDTVMSDTGALIEANPDLKSQIISPDGKIYFLTDYYDKTQVAQAWMVRKDWMEKLNIPNPETPEDLFNMLKAFKTQDPNGNKKNDEIPLNFATLNYAWMMTYQWWGITALAPWNWMAIEDGKVYDYVTDPGFRECIEFMKRCYAEGLINQDILNVAASDFESAINDDRTGLFFGMLSSKHVNGIKQAHPDSSAEYKVMMPPKAPESKSTGMRVYGNTNGYYFASSAGKNQEDAMRVMNYIYAIDEGRVLRACGIENETYVMKNGLPYPSDKVLNPPQGKTSFDVIREYGVLFVMANSFSDGVTAFTDALVGTDEWIQNGKKMLAENITFTPEMALRFTDAEVTETAAIHADIDTYITETLASVIVGKGTMKDFDDMVSYVKETGIDKITAIYQAAYDRSNG